MISLLVKLFFLIRNYQNRRNKARKIIEECIPATDTVFSPMNYGIHLICFQQQYWLA